MKLILISAISLDGFINRTDRGKINFTSPEDKTWFISETQRTGVAIMGSSTFFTRPEPLPNCFNVVMTRDPSKIPTNPRVWATDLSPAEVLDNLELWGNPEVTLLGGGQTNTAFLQAGLIDEAYLTITPHYFGSGVPLFADGITARMELLDSSPLGKDEILNHYKILKD